MMHEKRFFVSFYVGIVYHERRRPEMTTEGPFLQSGVNNQSSTMSVME